MPSSLFLRETGRRLRSTCSGIEAEYLYQRYAWMSAFRDPKAGELDGLIEALADAVECNAPERFAEHIALSVETMLHRGTAPIVVLAAADLFDRAVLSCLTPDQQDVVQRFLAAARDRRQLSMSAWFQRIEAAGA